MNQQLIEPGDLPTTRRGLIGAGLAGLTVLVAGRLGTGAVAAQVAGGAAVAINAWIAIGRDGRVRLQCAHSEMGQGIVTTFGAILADELGADWAACDVVFSAAGAAYRHPLYDWQFTGNSESVRTYHGLIRRMAAAAREMLVAAAAERLRVSAAELTVEAGLVRHGRSGRAIGFGEIAEAAALQPVPAEPRLKPESQWRLVGGGRSLPRRDIPTKVTGEAVFGTDVKVPGMVHAAVMSAPIIGGKLEGFDDAEARRVAGFIATVPLGGAVAVVAEHYWQARMALEMLKPTWRPGPGGEFDDRSLQARYDAAMAAPADWVVAERHGEAETAMAGAKPIEATYHSPWQAHAPMEPMNATVSVTPDGVTVWAPTQGTQMTQVVLAGVLAVAPEKVTVVRTYLGGGFGRRLIADFAVQAALCSKAVGRPVKLIWSREEDIRQDWFRPAFEQRLAAVLDTQGLPRAFHHRLVAPTILAPVSPVPIKPGMIDTLCVEGLVEHPYAVAHRRVDYKMLELPIPTMVLRTTGHGPNNFALESFVDELALAAGQDGYRYRRRLLAGNPAALAVLDRAAELSGWSAPPAGRYLGMAFADCFRAYLAQVVELSLEGDAFKIHRIVSVVDPGRVLDRVNAISMIEGGVVWGLSSALYSEITFEGGTTRETNFDGYRVATLPDVPELVTDFLENRATLGGLGEVGPVGIPAALCNALFAATAKRHRTLPLSRQGVFSVHGKASG
ncbi:xanthine dehydrogenase family protein molybdopterin-binding subunit [Phreatobacter stygius]|uniref:Xanthine dehydrogenase family protein molybdopterin-binding subunit n=1 Tax=Phreatobacter stygius TaxID=1940610 RepID=A0A4D7B8U7_9HYPH|nr:molybdopterin cofactor-binding domain-containing protein [Phreatobacter stygius]QCI66860.1 xanthine dehydrogenase family protein molybdopterin-binding subunit [Phreatobacter stygius]